MLKRYLLFAGNTHYACGGWRDFKNSFDTVNESEIAGKELIDGRHCEWYHVVDSQGAIAKYPEDQIVAQSSQQAYW
jgi:hypothetical protein